MEHLRIVNESNRTSFFVFLLFSYHVLLVLSGAAKNWSKNKKVVVNRFCIFVGLCFSGTLYPMNNMWKRHIFTQQQWFTHCFARPHSVESVVRDWNGTQETFHFKILSTCTLFGSQSAFTNKIKSLSLFARIRVYVCVYRGMSLAPGRREMRRSTIRSGSSRFCLWPVAKSNNAIVECCHKM